MNRKQILQIQNKVQLINLLLIIIAFNYSTVYGQSVENKQDKYYSNPIVSGNWSDPGIIKVREDYYAICSSNEWQPGLPIIHSKDLIHWEYIGNVFLENPMLNTGETLRGVWGGEIAFNPNTKRFLIYAPIMGNIYVYQAEKPEGPYSEPIKLKLDGIDPGFFADDNGKLYIVSGKGAIMSLSDDGLRTEKLIAQIDISAYKPFEGPDIFKRGEFYYLLFSPGGTRPHQPSEISTMRAKSLNGPWRPDPQNPNMFCTDNKTAKFEGPAHGTLIEIANNDWWLLYHAHELSHYSLGRPMFMEPVKWKNKWWKPVNGRIPSEKNKRPYIKEHVLNLASSDEFNKESLGLQWFFQTKPDFSGKSWSLSERPGYLRIKTKPGDISSDNSLSNIFLQRVTAKKFKFTTLLDFDAKDNNEKAGLHMYHDPGMNFWLASSIKQEKKIFEVGKYNNGKKAILWTAPNNIGNKVFLKIEVDGEETARFYYSANGNIWEALGKEIYFGDSWLDLRGNKKGNPDLGWIGVKKRNAWSAATFGVFAVSDGAVKTNTADFSFFRLGNHVTR